MNLEEPRPLPYPLVVGLLDDAATFPPGNARMREAVEARGLYADSWYHGLLGSFVVRADRVDELLDVLRTQSVGVARVTVPEMRTRASAAGVGDQAGATPLDVTVTVPTGPAGVSAAVRLADHPLLRLVGVEVPLGATEPDTDVLLGTRLELPPGVPLYVELAGSVDPAQAMHVLAEAGVRAKLRTGGTSAADFPSEGCVARFVHSAVRAGVPFKATAGLHNAVRHRDPETGLEHHGFLNLLAATTAVLLHGASEHEVGTLVAARDAEVLVEHLRDLTPEQAAQVRQSFTGFGTCSTLEPVEDLAGLGLLARVPVGAEA